MTTVSQGLIMKKDFGVGGNGLFDPLTVVFQEPAQIRVNRIDLRPLLIALINYCHIAVEATISAATLDSAGQVVMESILEAKASTILRLVH